MIRNKNPLLLSEGWKARHLLFSADPVAMNDERTQAFTSKIVQKYPDGHSLAEALIKVSNKFPDRKERLTKFAVKVDQLSGEDYYEFVRKNLAGNSGFWKNVLYYMLPFTYWYKLFTVDQDLKANHDPDQIIDRFSKGKVFFR